MGNFRILIIEDFDEFRRLVVSLLYQAQFDVIYEASDGLDGVRQTQALYPDLVLLDIGLPGLNGIEAARQILKLSPNSKILFLTQESAPEIVQAALSLGAQGYVLKTDAESELLPAINAVLHGEQFVSSWIRDHHSLVAGREPEATADAHVSELQVGDMGQSLFHAMACYRDETSLLNHVIWRSDAALRNRNAVVIVANQSRRRGIRSALQQRGLDVDAAIGEGRYFSLDSYETLSALLIDDWPDAARLRRFCDALIERIMSGRGSGVKVLVYGECAPILWAQGKFEAAIALERLLNEIVGKDLTVDRLCGYVMNHFHGERNNPAFERILAEHSASYSL